MLFIHTELKQTLFYKSQLSGYLVCDYGRPSTPIDKSFKKKHKTESTSHATHLIPNFKNTLANSLKSKSSFI